VSGRWRAGLAVAGALLAGGCFPDAATSQGNEVRLLYDRFLIAAAMVATVVFVPLVWTVLRHRRRTRVDQGRDPAQEPLPPQTHGSLRLELLWTAGPAITIAILFALTVGVLGVTEARSDAPAAEVRVQAFRWGWRFDYPRDGVTVIGSGVPGPEMVLPAGVTVRVTLEANDVQHAWYVPEFLMKRDAIPGRTTDLDLLIESPGVYGGQCAEFCGLLHAGMPFSVRAVSEAEYATWLAQQQQGAG
jgi:cytochrome c oxidase subunit 2